MSAPAGTATDEPPSVVALCQVTVASADLGLDEVGQHIVLTVLWQQDGLTPGEIARRLDAATPTIVNTATRMEEAGLVIRRPDPADARLVRLYLSPLARSVREPVRDARDALERHATATLTAAELEHLHSALTKIIAQLRNESP